MSGYADRCPVVVVTGFLGSGKTTLLNRALKDPALGDCAVLVNEFGEVGLDHHLLEVVDGNTVLLASGCVCCTIRDDLKSAVLELEDKRLRGEVPAYSRLVIETTGLADPTPVIATFMSDVSLRHRFRPSVVVTTVDCAEGGATLDAHPESVKQAALADRLVLTKTDIAGEAALSALRARLAQLNRSAELLSANDADFDAAALLRADVYTPAHREQEVARWFESEHPHGHATHASAHADGIHAFSVEVDEALDWSAFGVWLTLLLHRHGDRVLRVKGLLNVVGADTPVVVNGVQHLVHPPVHLARWPDAGRRSRIVFIVKDLERDVIEESLKVFNSL
ncbi:MAG: GTP-binding protein [Proteobacteria bacterium]|nr:GTP-binding protein [Pseudomonadota bacterium]